MIHTAPTTTPSFDEEETPFDRDNGIGLSEDGGSASAPSSSSTSEFGSKSSDTTTRASTTNDEQDLKRAIIEGEERDVRCVRFVVVVVFSLCSVAVTLAVYFFTKKSTAQTFEQEYDGYVKDIISLVVWEVRYNFALMEQLSASITIATHLQGSTFPNHTEPEFEITGGFVDGMGGIMAASFSPLLRSEEMEQWEEYSVANQGWIENSAFLRKGDAIHSDALHGTIQDHEHDRRLQGETVETPSISKDVFYWENGVKVPETIEAGKMIAPLWQVAPVDRIAVNANLLADERIANTFDVMVKAGHGVMSSNTEIGDLFDFLFDPEEKPQKKLPHAFILLPIFKEFVEEDPEMVGFLTGVTVYSNLLDRLLPKGKNGIIGVLKDTCGNVMSFELSSGKADFLGYEDVHETDFDEYERLVTNIELYTKEIEGLCQHDLYLYPSSKFRKTFETNEPYIYAGVVALSFLGTAVLLLVYDVMVNRRQSKTMKIAARTQAIVTSLFPKDIGKKLVAEAYDDTAARKDNNWKKQGKAGLRSLMGTDSEMNDYANSAIASKPLADLFPEATIMFGDLVGFTAWSSMRDPSQVFMLLESLYAAFDDIAKRRKVFKVETVGDCYVAVCGVPDPRKDHATTMVRFARDCLSAMHTTLQQLTVHLGPDTTELGMRVGLHSGPVTAGVLRGDRARFQLFGDTVNTTARLESTGSKNRIHVSQETADLITAAGKQSWITPRASMVHAKGKGQIQTFWVFTKGETNLSSYGASTCGDSMDSREGTVDSTMTSGEIMTRTERPKDMSRVIDWTVEVLLDLLREIVARRQSIGAIADSRQRIHDGERKIQLSEGIPFEELEPFFHLPKYTSTQADVDPSSVKIDAQVIAQLRDFVACISDTYHENPFHNFEHASHVTLSVVKLLRRIVAPDERKNNDMAMHDHTYGITSDPLTQFSVVLSALLHDVDHVGVPNSTLVNEENRLAGIYHGKSVAEQNSVDIAWDLLMDERFEGLRQTIYSTGDEMQRFRQMLVHTILATDIIDRELSRERKERWYATFGDDKASNTGSSIGGDSDDEMEDENEVDRKATIVIEHLMQASDVAHTMQHWHVYRKWNSRLFRELYKAYKEGRSDTDPSTNWYKGEIGFFDFYIIPLAQKLKSCGVFGVSSDEYLNYARQNRAEWEAKGEEAVQELVAEMEKQYST